MSTFANNKDVRLEKVPYGNAEYPIYINCSRLSSYPNYTAPPHWHDDIEFVIIVRGSMTYSVNEESIKLIPDEGILVNSRQMHFGYSDTQEECEFIYILLHPMALCLTPDMERHFVTPVLQNSGIPFIHLSQEPWHQDIAMGIRKIYSLQSSSSAPLKIQSIFTWMWALIYENMPDIDRTKQMQCHNLSILKKMISFIQQHFNEKITLGQIASSGGIGQSKCCKLFDSYIHQTPNAYLTAYRLHKSTELLHMTDLNITEIAYETGFSGASYYAKTFRKYFGISPLEYRKNK